MASEAQLAHARKYKAPNWTAGSQPKGRGGNEKLHAVAIRRCRLVSAEMVDIMITCARDPEAPWPSRLIACENVLNRAWGKPKETVQVEGEGVTGITISIVSPTGEASSIMEPETRVAIIEHEAGDTLGIALEVPKSAG